MDDNTTMFCQGARHNMERFMEICLLLLLYQEAGHGYALADQLTYFGFSREELNIGSMYRTLRKMEKDRYVTSCWEEGVQGPRKRVYQVTETGKRMLTQWIAVLKGRKKRITRLINNYEKIMTDNYRNDRKVRLIGDENF